MLNVIAFAVKVVVLFYKEGVSKSTPSFLYDKAPTFTSWGFVIT